MKLLAALMAVTFLGTAHAQPAKKDEAKKPEAAKPAEKKKRPRPRVGLQKNGTTVGDDASGGGGRSGDSSKGGTPGTPSGSFTGTMPKP